MAKFIRNQQIINSELEDNLVMMHIDKGKYYGLNQIGKRIWELLDKPKDAEEITSILLKEFNVSQERCMSDVESFMQQALKCDIIRKSE
jgi:Coenzyme PQQ synthesis protein D (PqqD).